MQVSVAKSNNSDAASAVNEIAANIRDPKLLIFISAYANLKEVSENLCKKFPKAEIIGTSGTSYYETKASDQSLIAVGFGADSEVAVGVIRGLSTCPIADLNGLEDAVNKVSPENDKTVCLEFCTNEEERLVTTMNVILGKKNIPIVGGSVFGVPAGKSSYVVVNGQLYEDACCYAVVKNKSGRILTFSENIYEPRSSNKKHVATKVNLANKEIITLDNRPAADVYAEELGISRNQVVDNVLECPLGRIVGDEVFISSMYEIGNNGSLINYKKINENDTISILQLMDYDEVNANTRSRIKSEASHISLILSVNCIYRHMLFTNEHYLDKFLGNMAGMGLHVGVVGGGEQYKNQHVNQTMVCAVFE